MANFIINYKFPYIYKKKFPIEIYHSFQGKPGDVNEYFKKCINEFKNLITYGVQLENKQINFKIVHIVADAPTKAFLLKVKNHNGYLVCNSCEVEGHFIKNKIYFFKFVCSVTY